MRKKDLTRRYKMEIHNRRFSKDKLQDIRYQIMSDINVLISHKKRLCDLIDDRLDMIIENDLKQIEECTI